MLFYVFVDSLVSGKCNRDVSLLLQTFTPLSAGSMGPVLSRAILQANRKTGELVTVTTLPLFTMLFFLSLSCCYISFQLFLLFSHPDVHICMIFTLSHMLLNLSYCFISFKTNRKHFVCHRKT